MLLSRQLVRSTHVWRTAPMLLLGASLLGLTPAATSTASRPAGGTVDQRADAQATAATAAAYGHLPLSFEPNQGQADPAVDFVAHGQGYSLSLTAGDLFLNLHQPSTSAAAGGLDGAAVDQSPSVLSIELQGADPHPQAVGQAPLPGTANYFIGSDPSQWHTSIPTYARVQYQDVYPGIDLVYYSTRQGQLEDDFVVAAGADPGSIRLNFEGADGLGLDQTGALSIGTTHGQVSLLPPVAYQERPDRRVLVSASYLLTDGQVGVAVGSYDTSQPLVIDPVLAYSTYVSNLFVSGSSIAVDAAGNAYVAGGSVIDKLNPTGTALVYSTVLGPTTSILLSGIAVDADGNAYVTGATGGGLPTTAGAFQPTYPGTSGPGGTSSSAFVSKLNSTGTALLYSTFLGGSSVDTASGIGVDGAGNAYVAGNASSSNFPTTPGAFQATFPPIGPNCRVLGCAHVFVSKLNPSGSGLVYSTFLGGSSGEVASSIAVGGTGNVSVTGETISSDFPTTPGAFQRAFQAGQFNPFVSELNPTGTGLVYSILGFGGAAIAVDSAGSAYLTGSTFSADFPTTPGAFQRTFQGRSDAFVSKLNPAGTGLVYSTLLTVASTSFANGSRIAVDAVGNAYITGVAGANFPTTPGAFQRTKPPGPFGDPFVTKLNPTGSALVYSSYLGGTGRGNSPGDNSSGIAVDTAGDAYIAGVAVSIDFPITPGAFESTTQSNATAYIAKMSPGPPACEVAALLPGRPTQLNVAIHADRGLSSALLTQATNTAVAIAPLTQGSTDTQVTATKLDQSAKATFTLRATDQTGSSTECDPVLVTVGRAIGDSPAQVIHHAARAESHVTISNGTPGVQSLRLLVNGHRFEATDLQAGEQRRLDVSSAMRQGSDNTILVIAHGPRSSSALVMVSDS